MFSGIVKGFFKVSHLKKNPELMQFSIELPDELIEDLVVGASVAIDGTCLTVVSINDNHVWFDAIKETLTKTNLKHLEVGSLVNVERSAKWCDEIGGHALSGHIYGEVKIEKMVRKEHYAIIFFQLSQDCKKFLFKKGFVALNGVSLTIVDIDEDQNLFSCHLIPETLKQTTFGLKKEGDFVNIEFDSQTLTIVETLSRLLQEHLIKK